MYSNAEYVLILKAMSDETRLNILKMLSSGELCACKILESFNITQPTLSYHMKILTDCGLVTGVRDGAWMRYNLNLDNIEKIYSLLNTLKESEPNQVVMTDVCK